MTLITRVLAVPASGACYCEDLSALRSAGAKSGVGVVRHVPEAVSVGLVLDDERVAWGDCVAMAPSGGAGCAAAFRSAEGLDTVRRAVAPQLEGRTLTTFRELTAEVDALLETVQETRPLSAEQSGGSPAPKADDGVEDRSRRALLTAAARLLSPFPDDKETGQHPRDAVHQEKARTVQVTVERQLHPAVRYGVSQALLGAVALNRGITMAEVIAEEWDLPQPDAPVAIHALSGRERYINAEKMIVRRLLSLPDAAVDNFAEQVGDDGSKLSPYIRWLQERIQELGGKDYLPTIHVDLDGALGRVFKNQMGRVLGHIYLMEYRARPYPLRVVSPVILDSREGQIEAMKRLRKYTNLRRMSVQLVVDEWADSLDDIQAFIDAQAADMLHIKMPGLGSLHNSVEAVLACQAGGVAAYLGGSPAETDLAARVAVHVALATRPDLLMARPGTGVDESVSLVQNEMARTLALIQARGR